MAKFRPIEIVEIFDRTVRMCIKRAIPLGLLAVVIVAAALSLTRLGLFHRASTGPPPSPVARYMSQTEIEGLLRQWSYPGARNISRNISSAESSNQKRKWSSFM